MTSFPSQKKREGLETALTSDPPRFHKCWVLRTLGARRKSGGSCLEWMWNGYPEKGNHLYGRKCHLPSINFQVGIAVRITMCLYNLVPAKNTGKLEIVKVEFRFLLLNRSQAYIWEPSNSNSISLPLSYIIYPPQFPISKSQTKQTLKTIQHQLSGAQSFRPTNRPQPTNQPTKGW